ncbi:stage II sporulation protein P [Lysinibacillus fusiformis]|uniref:stage II sporulation protein P n=1 Tax=Ureibacillus chungkukjangi TaxID=1202712 RepID=UPI000D360713|nr:stage II sporulation protein P [Ureibacillus chungkukjangi]MCM3389308.1 stage II sporulation protein P [Ureibacillus chungkukjangi]MDI7743507.1 stage II sporulation protein P [Lysinibacillus fusiformis]
MAPNFKDNRKNQSKKTIPEFLLCLAIFLFIVWLLVFLWFILFNEQEMDIENKLLNKSNFVSEPKTMNNDVKDTVNKSKDFAMDASVDANKSVLLESPTRDEFQPSMDNLFKERELINKNIGALFENMKSPKEISSLHSTFGKEVIYIYHSHSRESFLPFLKDAVKPQEAYHSSANVTLVGKMLARLLERRGIGTRVDSTDIAQVLTSKDLNYGRSYNVSGELARTALSENRELEYFIDVHRDSLRKDATTIEINGLNFANLLFVVGTGHKDFEKNLTFAEGLQTILDKQYPGLSKGIIQKSKHQGNGIYNQDISPHSIIVEIGGVDNTIKELHRTTEIVAEVLSEYYWHGER